MEVLLFQLEQGPTAKGIIEQAARTNTPLPDKLANAPALLLGLQVYYDAFLALTTCRAQGYGVEGPISWTTIAEYADREGFEDEQREDLFHYVAEMDRAYLQFQAKRITPRPQTGKGGKSKGRAVKTPPIVRPD